MPQTLELLRFEGMTNEARVAREKRFGLIADGTARREQAGLRQLDCKRRLTIRSGRPRIASVHELLHQLFRVGDLSESVRDVLKRASVVRADEIRQRLWNRWNRRRRGPARRLDAITATR